MSTFRNTLSASWCQLVRCTDESACGLHLSCLKRQWGGCKWRVQLFCWVDIWNMRKVKSVPVTDRQTEWSVPAYSVTATVGTRQKV